MDTTTTSTRTVVECWIGSDRSHFTQLTVTAEDVLDRVQQRGDLLASLDDSRAPLPER